MDSNKRHVVEGWLEKASTHLRTAEAHLESRVHYSDAVQTAQVCVELSVKGMLGLLDVDFPKSHSWDKERLAKIAEQIQKRSLLDKLTANLVHIGLPRLLFLANFWDQFYLQAKYGMEAGYLASAQDLFGWDEAEIAIKHANECLNAAQRIRFLSDDEYAAVTK